MRSTQTSASLASSSQRERLNMQDDAVVPHEVSENDPLAAVKSQAHSIVSECFPDLRGVLKMSTQTYVQYALMQLTIDFGAKRAVTGSVGGHKRSSSKHVTLVELAKRLRQLKGTLDLLELEGWIGATDFIETAPNFVKADGSLAHLVAQDSDFVRKTLLNIETWIALQQLVAHAIPIAERAAAAVKPPPHRAKHEYLHRYVLCLARAWILATQTLLMVLHQWWIWGVLPKEPAARRSEHQRRDRGRKAPH